MNQLKNSTLLREARQIEQEENNLKVVNKTTKSSISMATNVDNLYIQNCDLEKNANSALPIE